MEDEIKYMRIGTSLYKVVRRPGYDQDYHPMVILSYPTG